jgi:hypothetical protein
MIYVAAVLALIGLVAGFGFRLKVLLAMLALCIVVSVIAGVVNYTGLTQMATTTALALSLLQTSYFFGAVTRAMMGTRLNSTRASPSSFSKSSKLIR